MQAEHSDTIKTNELTIEAAAQMANVSTATIRNWIKAGYLAQLQRGTVLQESLTTFIDNITEAKKLNSRANKSRKDQHDHEKITENLNHLINNCPGEKIGEAYEALLSDSYRNKEGIYYTPPYIIRDMLKGIPFDSDTRFLDPSCGSGNFIIEAIRKGISPQNVYGFDTDENAVAITKERIKQEFGVETDHIKVADFLSETQKLKAKGEKFDLIFTNPPWGKKLEKSEKENLSALYGTGKCHDTSVFFMFASFKILKKGGILGFLIQEAFFNITTFEDARKHFLASRIVRLSDYGKAFKGLLTKAQAILIKNEPKQKGELVLCQSEGHSYTRIQDSFQSNPKSIFNFWANNEDSEVIGRLYSLPHTTLLNNAKWALGIVTGNNSKFCTDKASEGYVPVYRGADITKSGLKEPSVFIPNDFSNFQQVAPLEMYRAKEKLIYRFISSDLSFFCDKKQQYVLNSANLLIPSEDLGLSPRQITSLLNSDILNWLFKKLFHTHKILRGDLELLPIHLEYFQSYPEFSEHNYLEYLGITKTEYGTYRIRKQNY